MTRDDDALAPDATTPPTTPVPARARDLARKPMLPLRVGVRAGVRRALCTNED